MNKHSPKSTCIVDGFASPADEYLEGGLDFQEYLCKRPTSTFVMRMQSSSMQAAGIFSGDLIVIDRSLTACHRSLIVAIYQGELFLRRLQLKGEQAFLLAEDGKSSPLAIGPEEDFEVWGVVTHTIRHHLQQGGN